MNWTTALTALGNLRATLPTLVLAAMMALAPAAHAAPTDCIGQSADGLALCVPPEPGPRSVFACVDTQLSGPTALFRNCAVANGYDSTGGDQPLIKTYNCMLDFFGKPPISSLGWLPEGTPFSNENCWNGVVRYRWGLEVEGYGVNYPQAISRS